MILKKRQTSKMKKLRLRKFWTRPSLVVKRLSEQSKNDETKIEVKEEKMA